RRNVEGAGPDPRRAHARADAARDAGRAGRDRARIRSCRRAAHHAVERHVPRRLHEGRRELPSDGRCAGGDQRHGVKFAVTFGQLNPHFWLEAAVAADELGFDSIWLPEHLVFPVEMSGQLVPGEEHPPVPASTPVYDAAAYLSFIAAKTSRIRLGTFVYLLGIRHPFVGARAFATLDVVSGGRAEVGVGAGWLVNEWEAVGLDPRTRGRRFEEAM